MTLYEKYLSGQTEQAYQDILALGPAAFSPAHSQDVDAVLTEIFKRVAFNINIIYEELQIRNYLFKTTFTGNWERPLHPPLTETRAMITKVDKAVEPFGFIPLSLKYFYGIVGGVNFCWDYDTNDELMWELADPIQVVSLDAVLETVTFEGWGEEMNELIEEGDVPYLGIAADVFHKDNISGGMPYSLEITKEPVVDGLLLNEPHNTTFINYLRICFDNCGFPLIKRTDCNNDYQDFFDKVKPQLKLI